MKSNTRSKLRQGTEVSHSSQAGAVRRADAALIDFPQVFT
jgi:hypothetical protein